MSATFALYTTDANLLRCQVEFLAGEVRALDPDRVPAAVGLAYVEADSILLRKKPGDVGTLDLGELVRDVVSDMLLFHARSSKATTFLDEDAMPMRFRRWMFVHDGALGAAVSTRAALLKGLPEFMRRQVKGSTVSELCFLTFMKLLRSEGRTEDFDVPAPFVGRVLAETVRATERAERDGGVTRPTGLGFFVGNGRVMAATRLGSGPLHYALFEGLSRCKRCGIDEATPDSNPLLRAHRRVRAVALASDVRRPGGFIEVPESSVIAVGRNLEVTVDPLPAA
jgi:glutamine amidotransferase